jgi:hypothetical protein
MGFLVAAIATLIPGIAAWLVGRALVSTREDPSLPERATAALGRIALLWALMVALVFFSGVPAPGLWGFAAYLGLLAGWFPSRRTIRGETWGVGTFILHELRVATSVFGFWALLAAAPAIVGSFSGLARWVAAGGVGAALLVWNHFFDSMLLMLLDARPYERADLAAGFSDLAKRVRLPEPRLFQSGPRGAHWAAHIALASLSRSSIVWGNAVVERLDTSELMALYASELALLQRKTRRYLAVSYLIILAATAFAVLVVPALTSTALGYLTWAVVAFGAFLELARRESARLTEYDRRAIELGANPEALANAITKIYQAAQLPRRLDPKQEQFALIPTLARRLQAIRQTSPRTEGAPYRSPHADDENWPVVIRAARSGAVVIFEHERVHWLEGVPDDCASDADLLRRAARTVRSYAYSELAGLHLGRTITRARLLMATDRNGQRWQLLLSESEANRAFVVLERVDTEIGPLSGGVSPLLFARLLAVIGLILGTTSSPTTIVLGIVAVIVPAPIPIAALGATLVASNLLPLASESMLYPNPLMPFRIVSAIVGVVLLGTAIRDARVLHGMRRRGAIATFAVVGSFFALCTLGLIIVLQSQPSLLALHTIVRHLPTLLLSSAGLAGALALSRGRRVKLAAMAAAALTLLWAAIGSDAFRIRFTHDTLEVAGANTIPAHATAEKIGESRISGTVIDVRLSPDGSAFAAWTRTSRVLPDDEEDLVEQAGRGQWVVGTLGQSTSRTIDAESVAFIDEHTMLIASRRSDNTLVIESTTPDWKVSAPALTVREFRAGHGEWTLVGDDLTHRQRVRLRGLLGTDSVIQQRWHRPLGDVIIGSGETALRLEQRYSGPQGMLSVALGLSPIDYQMVLDAPSGRRTVAHTTLHAQCFALDGTEGFVCVTERTWRADVVRIGADGTITPIIAVPGDLSQRASAMSGRVLIAGCYSATLINLETRQAAALELPVDDSRACHLPRLWAGGIVTITNEGTSALVRAYRISNP